VTIILKPYQVSDLISQDIRTVDMVSDWLIVNLGTVKKVIMKFKLRDTTNGSLLG